MLTDVKIRQAKPRDKTYKLADGRGLYIEVSTNGSKYWRYKYRVTANGKRREKRLSLGFSLKSALRVLANYTTPPMPWFQMGETRPKNARSRNGQNVQ